MCSSLFLFHNEIFSSFWSIIAMPLKISSVCTTNSDLFGLGSVMCLVLFWLKCLVILDCSLFYVILKFSIDLSISYTSKDCGALDKVNQHGSSRNEDSRNLQAQWETAELCYSFLYVTLLPLSNYLCCLLLEIIIPGFCFALLFCNNIAFPSIINPLCWGEAVSV